MNMFWLIDKVLSGKATEAEKKELEEWIAKLPSNREEYEDMKLLWEFSSRQPSEKKPDPSFYDGLYRIKEVISSRGRKIHSAQHDWKLYLSFVALLISIIALVYCCVSYSRRDHKESTPLKFDNRPLAEVISVIDKHYKIEIQLENQEVLKCTFTGIIDLRTSKEEVITIVSRSLGLYYKTISSDRVELTGNGCRQ
jgi:ferric-dicitrate binding protein FerR (iron transport regulator)